jgi:hypothetical protein
MLRLIQCISFSVFLIIASGVAYSQEMMPLQKSPIDLVDDRAPSGKPFTFTITLPKERQNEKVWLAVYFTAGEKEIETSARIDKEEAKGNEVVYKQQSLSMRISSKRLKENGMRGGGAPAGLGYTYPPVWPKRIIRIHFPLPFRSERLPLSGVSLSW